MFGEGADSGKSLGLLPLFQRTVSHV
jgi:hypothetical protein